MVLITANRFIFQESHQKIGSAREKDASQAARET
jgi:hypothetical protein